MGGAISPHGQHTPGQQGRYSLLDGALQSDAGGGDQDRGAADPHPARHFPTGVARGQVGEGLADAGPRVARAMLPSSMASRML